MNAPGKPGGFFSEVDALVARTESRRQEMRRLCREAKCFRVPKMLATGGFRLRTTAAFNKKNTAIDECFHDFGVGQKFLVDFIAAHPPAAPKGGAA